MWLAGAGAQWALAAWLLLGSVAMRGAGCVYNDIVDADLDRLYFEYGDHKSGNANLFRSKEINFSVEDGEGKSQFVSPRARDVLLEGQPVFHVPIPDRMVQADRRAHDRIKVPDIAAPIVLFNLPHGRKAEGRLADLSSGGIGVIGVAADFVLSPGTVLRHSTSRSSIGQSGLPVTRSKT